MNHIHLSAIKPREKKYAEPCGKGLSLIVYPSGRKVWSFHGRIEGKVITKSLGDFPEYTEKAARAAIDALSGQKAESPIIRDVLAQMYSIKVKNGRIIQKYASENQRRFCHHLPALALMRIDEITAPKALAHIRPLTEKSQTVAQKMAQILKEAEIYAVNAGIKKDLCLQGIIKTLPNMNANAKPRTACEPSRFGEVLEGLAGNGHQDLIYFGIYTLLRASEIVAARADWINYQTMSIDIPAEVMKMKRPHRVPITPQLKTMLERLPKSGFLFPSPFESTEHISRGTLLNQFDPVKDLCVPHGVRSVGRTFMSESRVPFDVAEMCLAHIVGNAVSRRYDRSDLLEERRAVMANWCDFVDGKRPKA